MNKEQQDIYPAVKEEEYCTTAMQLRFGIAEPGIQNSNDLIRLKCDKLSHLGKNSMMHGYKRKFAGS